MTLLTVLAVGCGDGTRLGPVDFVVTMSDLAGAWTATKWEYTLELDPAQKADIVQQGGSAALRINASGTYSGSVRFPHDEHETPLAGTITLRGDSLVFQTPFAFRLTPSTLTLSGGKVALEDGDFGLTSDQFEVQSTLEIGFRRTDR
jgi:hypothetical protein